ncbi:MAG: hypothetical protein EZS28_009618, partial [Streblomastix strix]
MIEEIIGTGCFGDVKKGYLLSTLQPVAVKSMQYTNEKERSDIMNEALAMQKLDSPFIVKYYGNYNKKHKICLVLQFCEGGDCE